MAKSSSSYTVSVALILVAMIIAMWKYWPAKVAQAPVTNANTNTTAITNAAVSTGSIAFSTADVPDRDPAFEFRFAMPDTWAAQYVPDPKAIIFYQPLANHTPLENVQVTVRLATIVPSEKSDHTAQIDGQTTFWYQRSDPSAPPSLPSWEKQSHWEVWIPTKLEGQYYVVAQAPVVSDTIFSGVVSSFRLSQNLPTTNVQLQ